LAICERDPPWPSATAKSGFRRRLRGDLDNIVHKAMAKDPASKHVYDTYLARVPLINLRRRPLRVNTDRVSTVLADLDAKLAEMRTRAQAMVGWPINLGSAEHLRVWLYGVENLHVKARALKRAGHA
jgi:DNA polymerase I-like protein with 3'-5' exonuclease and polymerase domains